MATALVTTTEGLRPRESGLGLGTWPRNAPVEGFRTCTPLSPAAMNALPPTSSACDLDCATSAPANAKFPMELMLLSLKTANVPGMPWTTATLPPPTATQRASCNGIELVTVNSVGSSMNRLPASPEVAYTRVPDATLVAGKHELIPHQCHDLEHRGRREPRVARGLGEVDVDPGRRDGADVGVLEQR